MKYTRKLSLGHNVGSGIFGAAVATPAVALLALLLEILGGVTAGTSSVVAAELALVAAVFGIVVGRGVVVPLLRSASVSKVVARIGVSAGIQSIVAGMVDVWALVAVPALAVGAGVAWAIETGVASSIGSRTRAYRRSQIALAAIAIAGVMIDGATGLHLTSILIGVIGIASLLVLADKTARGFMGSICRPLNAQDVRLAARELPRHLRNQLFAGAIAAGLLLGVLPALVHAAELQAWSVGLIVLAMPARLLVGAELRDGLRIWSFVAQIAVAGVLLAGEWVGVAGLLAVAVLVGAGAILLEATATIGSTIAVDDLGPHAAHAVIRSNLALLMAIGATFGVAVAIAVGHLLAVSLVLVLAAAAAGVGWWIVTGHPQTRFMTALVVDLFPRTIERSGSLIRHRHLRPAIKRAGGWVVDGDEGEDGKTDSIYALFRTPDSALQCVYGMREALARDPKAAKERLAVGISDGRVYLSPSGAWGGPCNEATTLRTWALTEGERGREDLTLVSESVKEYGVDGHPRMELRRTRIIRPLRENARPTPVFRAVRI